MKTRIFPVLAALVLALGSNTVRSADLTWTGSISSDWNNPTNWTPQQVPTASDHIIINSGSVTIPADGAFETMDWTGGSIGGSLTVASNGVLNLHGGSGTLFLGGSLTNAGTVNWLDGNLTLDGCNYFPGPVINLPGGLWDVEGDFVLFDLHGYCGGRLANSYFQNEGTVRKSAGAGTFLINMPFNNYGTIEADTGTISISDGGIIGGGNKTEGGGSHKIL